MHVIDPVYTFYGFGRIITAHFPLRGDSGYSSWKKGELSNWWIILEGFMNHPSLYILRWNQKVPPPLIINPKAVLFQAPTMGISPSFWSGFSTSWLWVPSGNDCYIANWKITIFNGKTHYKWWFSIAMLSYQRVFRGWRWINVTSPDDLPIEKIVWPCFQ